MPEFKEITSRENSLIKLTSKLQGSSKERKTTGLFVLEGLRICRDAMDNGIMFDKLIISKSAFEKYKSELDCFSAAAKECFLLPDSLFKRLSETENPQGILAICKKPDVGDINFKRGRFIALENIQDPSNLGAIARSCEALGANGLIISDNGCDPYSPKSMRASMGTLLRIPVIIFKDFSMDLKKTGLKTFACVVDGNALPINKAEFCDGCAVLIGNEANGLTAETVTQSDFAVTIPMKGNAESLNASVAGAIAIWEMMK